MLRDARYILCDDADGDVCFVADVYAAMRYLRANGYASHIEGMSYIAQRDEAAAEQLLADLGFYLRPAEVVIHRI